MNGSEDSTQNLTENLSDRQLLLLLVERVSTIAQRVAGIEERVIRLEKAEEDRKLETRPLWERFDGQMEQVIIRLTNIEEEQRLLRTDMGLLREDIRNERRERAYLPERVTVLEKQRLVA